MYNPVHVLNSFAHALPPFSNPKSIEYSYVPKILGESMRRIIACLALMCSCALSFAGAWYPEGGLDLDKVAFQISAKQWVKTQSALLSVTVNAVLTRADLVRARADIMAHLNKVAPGDWHLTQFSRSQDNSGLDKLLVNAQARVSQSVLTDIYQNAKAVSRPGETYTISGVEFQPSLEEIQQVKASLRAELYVKINQEINQLNKVYVEQHYTINRINFVEGDIPPPVTREFSNEAPRAMMNATISAAPIPLTVSNELVMTAVTELASNRIRKDIPSNATPSN